MIIVLKSLLKTINGCKRMKTLFEDIVPKNTKQFIFRVLELNDGSYEVIQQSCRVFPDKRVVVQSERNGTTLTSLRYGKGNMQTAVRDVCSWTISSGLASLLENVCEASR
ncbi:hypothetical protein [Buttiauxella sp. 3AFRM03]|uniref:hypothetical protein n=1 Tax=Buttiauxella sp. 3AFRM03 TaxID=2479367 RepID=UPI001EE41730|nr:hypothetical protein [Buttiauxella sp. 3AFRM03]